MKRVDSHAGAVRRHACWLPTAMLIAAAGVSAVGHSQAQAVEALSQQPKLDAKFSCSAEHAEDRLRDGDRRLYADSGAFRLQGDTVQALYWESSLFRSNHGSDCSIDESDDLVAEALPLQGDATRRWRISLRDGRAARTRRGYDADHGVNCSIRIAQVGQQLQIVPSCPALCGSRENFSQLSVDLRTGNCVYEH